MDSPELRFSPARVVPTDLEPESPSRNEDHLSRNELSPRTSELAPRAPEHSPDSPTSILDESGGGDGTHPRRYPNLDEACRRYSLVSEDEEHSVVGGQIGGGQLRYSPPPPYNNEFTNYPRKMYTTSVTSDKDRIELRIRCPSISSLRWCLKLYCLVFGGIGAIMSLLWVVFNFYVLGETEIVDLRLQRYLDIVLGVVWLFSNVCLIYGGYSEAKNWIVIYTTGSLCVLVLYWSWSVYTSYVQLEQPAYSEEVENILIFLTLLYLILLVPILLFYRSLVLPDGGEQRRGDRERGVGGGHYSDHHRMGEGDITPRGHRRKLELLPREY